MLKPSMTVIENAVRSGKYVGFCTKCGKRHTEVEPDARKYPCAKCNTPTVYGAEELLMMRF